VKKLIIKAVSSGAALLETHINTENFIWIKTLLRYNFIIAVFGIYSMVEVFT